jgi:putative NADH-flavin reductase
MKIALFGGTGMIGQRILKEALERGHEVIVIARDPAKITEKHPHLQVKAGDVLNPASVAAATEGAEVVISSYGPGKDDSFQVVAAARSLVQALRGRKGVRVIAVGGAASLEVAPGVMFLDTPQFPEAWKPIATAHRDALNVFREADLDWTFFSPAGMIQPGERTGKFRLGGDQLLTDEKGESRISAEDYAVALLDEVEKRQFVRKRFTAAY